MKKDLLKGLTEAQLVKARNCKDSEELLKLAKEEGIELTDEQLESVNGGLCSKKPGPECPFCHGTNTAADETDSSGRTYYCNDCHEIFAPYHI